MTDTQRQRGSATVAASPSKRRLACWLLLVFAVAAGLRVGWVVVAFAAADRAARTQYPDEDAYLLSARSLAAGHGMIDEFGFRATYMPAYPAFLAVFQSLPQPLLWARLAQALLAALVAPATFLLAKEFLTACSGCLTSQKGTGSERDSLDVAENRMPRGACPLLPPLIAGLIAACDPFLVFFSGLLLSEALFAAVLVAAWASLLPVACRRDLAVGRLLAGAGLLLLSILLRPAAAFIVPVLVLALLVFRRIDRRGLIAAGVIVLVVVGGLLPWAMRNRAVTGRLVWLTTRGGISLYDGLQPGGSGGSDLAHTKTLPAVAGLSEIQWDDYFRRQAWATAREDPGRTLALAARKFLRTWSLVPNEPGHRRGASAAVSAVWMVLVLAAAGVGWWKCRTAVCAWLVLLLPVLVTTAVHVVFVGSVRYRVPVMPMLFVLAATGFQSLWKRAGCRG